MSVENIVTGAIKIIVSMAISLIALYYISIYMDDEAFRFYIVVLAIIGMSVR
jgi:hypothetical protein